MTGHEIEHYDLAPEAEVLPYGAREFAQHLGHQALAGGDRYGAFAEPQSALQLIAQPERPAQVHAGTEHHYMRPTVVPIPVPNSLKPGVVF